MSSHYNLIFGTAELDSSNKMQLKQPQVFMLGVIVTYFSMTQLTASEFSVDTVVSLAVGVLKHYLPSCVYFLYPTHQEGEYKSFTAFCSSYYISHLKSLCLLLSQHFMCDIMCERNKHSSRITYDSRLFSCVN